MVRMPPSAYFLSPLKSSEPGSVVPGLLPWRRCGCEVVYQWNGMIEKTSPSVSRSGGGALAGCPAGAGGSSTLGLGVGGVPGAVGVRFWDGVVCGGCDSLPKATKVTQHKRPLANLNFTNSSCF